MFVVIFIVSLIFAIMLHEFGHYATAKAFGMKVEKFFLGFGPTLWSVRRGETEYGVKAIPAGGFVKIIGMNVHEEVDPADAGRTFHEQSGWKKAIVLSAGSFTHFVLAAALIFAALTAVGVPNFDVPQTTTVSEVVVDSPAGEAGIKPGERIVAIDGNEMPNFDAIRDYLKPRGGEKVMLTVAPPGGDPRELAVTLEDELPDGTSAGFLGVGPTPVVEKSSAGDALAATVSGEYSVFSIAWQNLKGLGTALSPSALAKWFNDVGEPGPRNPEGPVSPLGVGQLVYSFGSSGDIFGVLFLLAMLNITLGTLNMLPLPPLDGGHLAVLVIEESVNGVRRLRGRAPSWRLDPSVITPVALAVILFFVVLSVTALYVDIVKPASGLLEQ